MWALPCSVVVACLHFSDPDNWISLDDVHVSQIIFLFTNWQNFVIESSLKISN